MSPHMRDTRCRQNYFLLRAPFFAVLRFAALRAGLRFATLRFFAAIAKKLKNKNVNFVHFTYNYSANYFYMQRLIAIFFYAQQIKKIIPIFLYFFLVRLIPETYMSTPCWRTCE